MADCTYCGCLYGEDRDHIIPQAYTSTGKRDYKPGSTVPACSECNGTLGSKLYITVATRAAYLLGTFRPKWKKIMDVPYWDDEELEDMGPTMRSHIEFSIREARCCEMRLEHLELVALYDPADWTDEDD